MRSHGPTDTVVAMRGSLPFLVLALVPGVANATELGDAALELEPGEWVELQTEGYGQDLLFACDGIHSIFEWANKGVWDPDRREVRYVGQGHYSCRKQIRYDEVSNAWAELPEPPDEGIGHAYEHNAIDIASGTNFYRHYSSTTIAAFDPEAGSWANLPDVPTPSVQVASAITYFPEAGGLVFVDSVAGVWLHADDAWTQLAAEIDVGAYNVWAVHNPAHGLVLFGGGNGSTSVYLLDETGTVSPTVDSPEEFGIARAAVIPDAGTGHYLAFADSGTVYELDPDDLEAGWWDAGTHPVMDYARDWRVYVPIATHGVIMALTWDFDDSTVVLYRHAETDPPRPPSDDSGDSGDSSDEGGDDGGDSADSADTTGGASDGGSNADGSPGGVDPPNPTEDGSAGEPEGAEADGCGCRTSSSGGPLALLVLLARLRRRRDGAGRR